MFCTSCGTRYIQGNRFCSGCGAKRQIEPFQSTHVIDKQQAVSNEARETSARLPYLSGGKWFVPLPACKSKGAILHFHTISPDRRYVKVSCLDPNLGPGDFFEHHVPPPAPDTHEVISVQMPENMCPIHVTTPKGEYVVLEPPHWVSPGESFWVEVPQPKCCGMSKKESCAACLAILSFGLCIFKVVKEFIG